MSTQNMPKNKIYKNKNKMCGGGGGGGAIFTIWSV